MPKIPSILMNGVVARNANGSLYLFITTEAKTPHIAPDDSGHWECQNGSDVFEIDPGFLPDLKKEDGPQEVTGLLTLKLRKEVAACLPKQQSGSTKCTPK